MRDVIIGVLISLISVFVGAFLTYFLTIHQSNQEIQAKQNILLKTLYDELMRIDEKMQPYDANKVIYQDPIRISTLNQLLDGKTLEYKTHENLIKSILNLQVAIAKYNDLLSTTNLTQSIVTITPTAHGQIYEVVRSRHQAVVKARDEVLKWLPKE